MRRFPTSDENRSERWSATSDERSVLHRSATTRSPVRALAPGAVADWLSAVRTQGGHLESGALPVAGLPDDGGEYASLSPGSNPPCDRAAEDVGQDRVPGGFPRRPGQADRARNQVRFGAAAKSRACSASVPAANHCSMSGAERSAGPRAGAGCSGRLLPGSAAGTRHRISGPVRGSPGRPAPGGQGLHLIPTIPGARDGTLWGVA